MIPLIYHVKNTSESFYESCDLIEEFSEVYSTPIDVEGYSTVSLTSNLHLTAAAFSAATQVLRKAIT